MKKLNTTLIVITVAVLPTMMIISTPHIVDLPIWNMATIYKQPNNKIVTEVEQEKPILQQFLGVSDHEFQYLKTSEMGFGSVLNKYGKSAAEFAEFLEASNNRKIDQALLNGDIDDRMAQSLYSGGIARKYEIQQRLESSDLRYLNSADAEQVVLV